MNVKTKILSWNARGVRNKNEELFHFLEENNVDVCLLCETWLNKNFSIRNKNYYCIRNNCWGNILYGKLQLNQYQINFPHEHTYIPSDRVYTRLIQNKCGMWH